MLSSKFDGNTAAFSKKGISKLPVELLAEILERYGYSPADLVRQSLVCREWRNLCRPLLYKDIALATRSLVDWVCNSNQLDDSLVQTLTIREDGTSVPSEPYSRILNHDDNVSPHDFVNNIMSQLYGKRFAMMDQLTSLSILQLRTAIYSTFRISKSAFANLLKHLSPTVRYLEIDMPDMPIGEELGPTHLCPIIRNLLPRLRILHLRLQKLCPDLCGTGYQDSYPQVLSEAYQPTQASQLEELVIKVRQLFGVNSGSRTRSCGSIREEWPSWFQRLITRHLRAFYDDQSLTKPRRIWILDEIGRSEYPYTYEAIVRRDVITNQSCSLPYKNIAGFRKDGYWIRMPEDEGGEDFVSTYPAIREIVGGQTWIETVHGSRIPASTRSALEAHTDTSFIILVAEEFKRKTGISSMLWENEKRLQVRLLEAKYGPLLANDAPTETVPQGWVRNDVGELRRHDS